jgi:hypothetical protein
VSNRVKEVKNVLHRVQQRSANWISYIFRRNYLLKHVIEGKVKGEIEMTGRLGRIVEALLDKFRKREDTGN